MFVTNKKTKNPFAFILIFLISVSSYSQCLDGTYTIGGNNPDFLTEIEAIQALDSFGICGPVVFNFRSGTYGEIVLSQVSGASATNTITFKSEGNHKDSVWIEQAYTEQTNPENYCLKISGTNFCTFEKISFERIINSGATTVIKIEGKANNIRFNDVSIIGREGDGLNKMNEAVFIEADTIQNLSFTKVMIEGGYASFYSLAFLQDVLFDSCIIQNDKIGRILFSRVQNLTFTNNIANALGINVAEGTVIFNNNRIRNLSLKANESRPLDSLSLINNTFDHVGAYETSSAITLNNILKGKVLFNTISTNVHCCKFSNSDNIELLNNVLHSSGMNELYIYEQCDGLISDYNYYISSSLNAQPLSGQDLHSKFINEAQDIDVSMFNVDFQNNGTYIPDVVLDIDNRVRNNPPSIGAEEIELIANDALFIQLDSLQRSYPEGMAPIYGSFRNIGKDTIKTIKLNCRLSFVEQEPILLNLNIASGDSSGPVLLTNNSFERLQHYNYAFTIAEVNGTPIKYRLNNSMSSGILYTIMNGVHTIGGLNPDFPDFKSATTQLRYRNGYGKIEFLVRDGEYDELIVLSKIELDSSCSVIFRSENGDASSVILINSSSYYYNNHILDISNSNNISFYDVSMERKNSNYHSKLIDIDGSDNITIQYCILNGETVSNTGGYGNSVILIKNSNAINISNNCIKRGTNGISFISSDNCTLTNCEILESNDYGVYIDFGNHITISSNRITESLYPENYDRNTGIYLKSSSDSINIFNNEITLKGGIGLYLTESGSSDIKSKFWNNVITITNGVGINIEETKQWDILYNSLNVYGDTAIGDSGNVANIELSEGINIEYNIFSNLTKGNIYPLLPDSCDINYNNNYFPYGKICTGIDSLKGWHELGFDTNSFNVNPQFLNDSNLHILQNSEISNKGIPVSYIKRDLDGKLRDEKPDIGAYEFKSSSSDVFISELNSPNSNHALNKISVSLYNNGPDTLRQAFINWQINDSIVQKYRWKGELAPNSEDSSITLCEYIFDINKDYKLKLWTSDPNFSIDPVTSNDTIYIDTVDARMAGIYRIKGPNADFKNLKEAIEMLKTLGMRESVSLNLCTDLYDDWSTNSPRVISTIPGLGSTKSLTIQSEALNADSVLILYGITLDNVSNINIRHLTLIEDHTNCIELINGCENISIESNKIVDVDLGIYVKGGDQKNHSFRNNHFENNNESIYIEGTGTNPFSNIQILDNTSHEISDCFLKASYLNNSEINSNDIHLYTDEGDGINLINCSGEINIIKNNILIEFREWSNFSSFGIKLESCTGNDTTPIQVYNNMISLKPTRSGHANNIAGIYNLNSSYVNYYHNSIDISVLIQNLYGYGCVYVNGGVEINIINNIFQFLGYFSPIITIIGDTSVINTCDYNLYHAYDSGKFKGPGKNATIDMWNFYEWQQNTFFDQNSVFFDPSFVSNIDLHINKNIIKPFLSDTIIDFIDYDFDGDMRNIPTTYGADDFELIPNNASIVDWDNFVFCEGSKNIKVWLKNTGSDTLRSANIHWEIDTIAQETFGWVGTLKSNDSILVDIGTYDIQTYNNLDFKAWPELPNGFEDLYSMFDTIFGHLRTSLSGHFTVRGNNPDFHTLQGAIDTLELFGICDSVVLNIRPGNYYSKVEIPYIKGTNDSCYVIIQSESQDSSSVVYELDENVFIFTLTNTNYIVIQHLTLVNNATSNKTSAGQIKIHQRCKGVSINNISFRNSYYRSGRPNIYIGYVHTGGYETSSMRSNRDIEILNNTFNSKGCGIEYVGPYDSLDVVDNFFLIKDNVFRNSYIDIAHAYGPKIKNNSFEFTSSFDAITIIGLHGLVEINSNRIHGNAYRGLMINENSRNSPIASLNIVNNEISINSDLRSFGIYLLMGNSLFMANNSVLVKGNEESCIVSFDNIKSPILNNQFINLGGGPIYRFNSLLSDSSLTVDYNNYFTTGIFAKIGDTVYDTFESFKQDIKSDSNSIFINPLFLNDSTLISQENAIKSKGIFLPQILTDINGRLRGNWFDIGAYELDSSMYDIGALDIEFLPFMCGDSLKIYSSVANEGSSTITSFDITLIVNDSVFSPKPWTGNLEQFGIDSMELNVIPIIPDSTYEVQVVLSNPNGSNDQMEYNNRFVSKYVYKSIWPQDIAICENDSILLGGSYRNSAGIYYDTLKTISGCDSIIKTNLTIHELVYGVDMQTACDSYTWIDGITYTQSNKTATYTLTNMHGCDSVVTLDLTITNSNTGFDSITECDSYTWIDGITYTQSNNTATHTLINVQGCDSIVTLDLTINRVTNEVEQSNSSLTALAFDAIYYWFDCDGAPSVVLDQTQEFVPRKSGLYAVHIIKDGCEATSECYEVVKPLSNSDFKESVSFKVYPNPTEGKIQLEFFQKVSKVDLLIRNITGEIINKYEFFNSKDIEFEIQGNSGLYIIEVIAEPISKKPVIFRLVKN